MSIAVFVDYDNIEIGVKSTLRREFDVSVPLAALKERGDIVAKFAYANWSRQEPATRQMAENAVQMVQRIPSPRGDKNGADINLALDALEMAFTHDHINAFAIVSGDSDFIPLVNKLKQYGKTVYVVGGKAFTSTILQQNCHEFISYESMIDEPRKQQRAQPQQEEGPREKRRERRRLAPLALEQAMPLVERALQVVERRGVQPQLGLLKSTMLQLDAAFTEKAYGAGSFSEFVEKLKHAGYINISGSEGRYIIERISAKAPETPAPKPEEALPLLRDVLETHRIEMESGCLADDLESWVQTDHPEFKPSAYGFQEFAEFLNYAQDKHLVRIEPDEEKGLMAFLGAEFYPQAPKDEPPAPEPEIEIDEPQPYVAGQPTIFEPTPAPPPEPVKRRSPRRKGDAGAHPTARKPRPRRTGPRRPPGPMV
jgi:uncharacterized protein (TIGR00288 family)